VIVAVRLPLDPTLYSWYWVGAETVVLVAVAELATELALLFRRLRPPVTRERPVSP
jgi:hypothetical protein